MERDESSEIEIWHVGRDATKRLQSLDLIKDDLVEPLELARADALMCTPLDAPGAQGYTFWTRGNRYVRERMCPRGWMISNSGGVLRTIHPGKKFSVTAISGQGEIGVPDGKGVQTKHPKGSAIAKLVRYNYLICGGPRNDIPLEQLELPLPSIEHHMMATWFLLYKSTTEGIMVELSLPSDMLGKAVNRWKEHIIVGPIEGGGPRSLNLDPDMPDEGPDVDVEIIS